MKPAKLKQNRPKKTNNYKQDFFVLIVQNSTESYLFYKFIDILLCHNKNNTNDFFRNKPNIYKPTSCTTLHN